MERISTVYDIDRSRYKTMKELIPWLFDKAGLLSLSCKVHKKNPTLIKVRWLGHSHRIQNERKSCSRSNECPMKRMRMKSFLLLVVHFCTFINQEENMSRTLLKAALALVLLWILVAWWSLGGAITETPPLCCGETQLSRSEREDQCPLPLFQPFVIPPTQPQPVVFQAYIRWSCSNLTPCIYSS